MKRSRDKFCKLLSVRGATYVAAGLVIGLSACDRGPGTPRPPSEPPRPVTMGGTVTTTHLELPARPVAPSPGMM